MCGAIRLLCVKWLLMQPDTFKMPNRQALEALEKSGASPSPLLSREAAAALVRQEWATSRVLAHRRVADPLDR
jgi:hypothetical protein